MEPSKKPAVPLLMLQQMSQTAAHTDMLVYQSSVLSAAGQKGECNHETDKDDSQGPGKGNSVLGSKAPYARRLSTRVFNDIRSHDPDFMLFEKTVHLCREDFNALHDLVRDELMKAMDVRRVYGEDGGARVPRRRRLDSQEMLFMFMDIMGGSNEGGIGVERIAHRYGISNGTVTNYFRHVLFVLYRCFDGIVPRLIRWPSAEERSYMEGLIIGFPRWFFVVDGNKTRRCRPINNKEQELAYDGYKKAHSWAVVVFCDLFGRFIRVEISDKGAESDRNLYTSTDVYKNPEENLSDGQHGMADMGFAGDGAIVVPYRRNKSTSWMFRTIYNRYLRRQRMVNEWGIVYINNRFRLFLGRWPFEKELFSLSYNAAVMLCNGTFDRRGYAFQPRERYEEKLVAHGRKDDSESE